MKRSAAAALALLAATACLGMPAQAGADAVEQQFLRAAQELDAAGKAARAHPHAVLRMPNVHVGGSARHKRGSNAALVDDWLQASLEGIHRVKSAKSRARDLAQLAAALRLLGSGRQAVPKPTADPAAEAVRILAQRAYQIGGGGAAPPPHETLWERFLGWVGTLIRKVFSGIFGATASAPIVGQIIAVLLVMLFVAAVAYLLARITAALLVRSRTRAHNEGVPLPERLDPDDLYRQGLAAADAGRYAQAIALVFQASLAAFDSSGKLAFDASLTPGEYRRAVRRKIGIASKDFDTLAHAFVMAAFAERPVSGNDWSAADAAYAGLRTAIASA